MRIAKSARAKQVRPVNVEWQARMAELLGTPHTYPAAVGDAVLPVVGAGPWH